MSISAAEAPRKSIALSEVAYHMVTLQDISRVLMPRSSAVRLCAFSDIQKAGAPFALSGMTDKTMIKRTRL